MKAPIDQYADLNAVANIHTFGDIRRKQNPKGNAKPARDCFPAFGINRHGEHIQFHRTRQMINLPALTYSHLKAEADTLAKIGFYIKTPGRLLQLILMLPDFADLLKAVAARLQQYAHAENEKLHEPS